MTKNWMIAAGCGACAAAAITAVAARKGCAEGDAGADKWERMRRKMEEMPDDFPPRVMFDNLATTRENTEEILRMLRQEQGAQAPEPEMARVAASS